MLKLAPENDWARRRLALNLSARSNDPAAWNEALTLVGEDAKGAESPDDRLLRATVLSRSPEPRYRNQAIEVLESLVAEIPTSARLHEVLARSYLMLGNRVKARDHAAKAAGQDASADAILFHASLALDDKDVAEAEKQLIRLIAIDPNAMPTVELNARIFHAKKNDAEAVALLERAYDVHRNSPDIQVVGPGILQVLIILEQFEAADKIGKQVAQIGPKGQIAYAQFLAGRGRNKEAHELLDSAFKAGAMADAVRSALALAAGNPDSRADWLDQTDSLLSLAIKGQPDSIELLQAQAYLRHLQRKYNEEINTYLSILSKNPVNFLFLNNMAWTLSEELGRPQDGLDRINEALKKVGWQAHLADTRGVILLRLGKADDAVKDLEAAVQILPTPTIQYHLALAYRKAGKTAEFETYRTLAKSNGIKLDQLQPSEREAAAKILDIAPTASKPPPSNPAAASKS